MSRKRNPFNIPHILAQMEILNITADGELWHPTWTFEQIVSAVKNSANDAANELEYHLFDKPNGGNGYTDRLSNIHKVMDGKYLPNIKIVPVALVKNEEEAEAYFHVIKGMPGVDGAVIRTQDYKYEFNCRSYDILKMKDTIHREYTISKVTCDADAIGDLIKFEFTGPEGNFLYSPAWSKQKRKEEYERFVANLTSYVGTDWTLEFREYTTKGLPKHIMDLTERNYE